MWTAEFRTVLLANVRSRTKNKFIRRLPHHAQSFALHVTTPALSFALAMILTMNGSRFQRTRLLNGTQEL